MGWSVELKAVEIPHTIKEINVLAEHVTPTTSFMEDILASFTDKITITEVLKI